MRNYIRHIISYRTCGKIFMYSIISAQQLWSLITIKLQKHSAVNQTLRTCSNKFFSFMVDVPLNLHSYSCNLIKIFQIVPPSLTK